jgi:anti-anti-sigma factor
VTNCRNDAQAIRFRIEDSAGGLRVALDGRLVFAADLTFLALLCDLAARRVRSVQFDLSGLSHIDSVGLGLLYIACETLGGVGIAVTLANPRETVQRTLDLTEATKAFKITRSSGRGEGERV